MRLSAVLQSFPRSFERLPSPLALFKRGLSLLSTACICATLLGGFSLFGMELRRFIRESGFFAVETLDISGASDALADEIRLRMGGVLDREAANLFSIKLGSTVEELEALPRVRKAQVVKEYPKKLRVHVVERLPVTTVNLNGDLFWVDREGFVLARAQPEEVSKSRTPVVTGVRGSRLGPGVKLDQTHLPEVLQTIAFLQENDPGLGRRFSEWHISPRNEVLGILNEGVEVRFGDSDPQRRLPVLASVLRLKGDWDRTTYLDLRFESQVVYF